MSHLKLFLFALVALPGCDHRSKTDDPTTHKPSDLVGTWKSEHSNFVVRVDGTFQFTPLIEENKSRGNGVWEQAGDGGFYIRYRAEDASDYRFSSAEYFRVLDGEPTFFYIDSSEVFHRIVEP